ncbi:MAG: hypothetical protein JNM94_07770 [Phycisphaerae bacterium]|nr:hypothetical protein [Phycisphaerae bacterium]
MPAALAAAIASTSLGDSDSLVFGVPTGTRPGWRLTQTRVDVGSPEALAASYGAELLLTSTELVIGLGDSVDADAFAPVVVWRRGDAPGDPMPFLGWSHAQDLAPIAPPKGRAGDAWQRGFGRALAGDDSWLFVGAPEATVDGAVGAGAVHVYRRNGQGSWEPFTLLTDAAPVAGGRYGAALAFDGATLVVGTPGRRNSALQVVGGADGFDVAAQSLSLGFSYVAPSTIVASLALGHSVAVDGATIALGDPDAALAPGFAPGLVLVLARDGQSSTLFVDQTLTTPTFAPGAKFGARLDLAGATLVVAAPGESNGALVNAGAMRLYRRQGPGQWTPAAPIQGEVAGAALARCDLDGDLLAIGAPAWSGQGGSTGRAWLYRVDGAAPVRVATIVPDPSGGAVTASGTAVAIKGGVAALTEVAAIDATGPVRTVRTLRAAAALTDCDGDGVSDLDETLAGAGDCDHDGVPDACATIDDCNGNGTPDSCDVRWADAWNVAMPLGQLWWGQLGHGPWDEPTALLIVTRQTVPSGTDGVVRGVATDWIGADAYPQPCAVAIYADPNQDGDPSDAQLLVKQAVSPTVGPGLECAVFDPVAIGAPGTRYFVGLAVSRFYGTTISMLVAEAAWSPGQPQATWYATEAPYDLDFETPSANPTFTEAPSNVLVAGLFRTTNDLDGDLVVDACACVGDLDHDGAVTPTDLGALLGQWGPGGSADLDGDGTVGPSDLGILLGAWGVCGG